MTHYEKPYIIAEAGCNHKGDMEIAKELINVAAMFCHADAIKFQKRCPKELLTPEQYNAPHPNPCNAYGDTYGAHHISKCCSGSVTIIRAKSSYLSE